MYVVLDNQFNSFRYILAFDDKYIDKNKMPGIELRSSILINSIRRVKIIRIYDY